MKKVWWKSKTLWANALAVVALFVQRQTGVELDPETQVGVLAVVNAVLRFVTKDPVGLRSEAP